MTRTISLAVSPRLSYERVLPAPCICSICGETEANEMDLESFHGANALFGPCIPRVTRIPAPPENHHTPADGPQT